jgi:hypothetical protein
MVWRHLKLVRLPLQLYQTLILVSTDSQSKSTIVNIATAEEMRDSDDWFAEILDSRRYG